MSGFNMAALNFLGESALIFGAGLILRALLAHRLRVALFRCAVVIACAAPIAIFTVAPQFSVFALPAFAPSESQVRQFAPAEMRAMAATRTAVPALAAHRSDTVANVALSHGVGWPLLLAALWAMGALAAFSRYLFSCRVLSRAFADGDPAPALWHGKMRALQLALGVRGHVVLRMSGTIAAPCTFGFWRARILLPARLALSAPSQTAVLTHELCHIRHRDALWLMLGGIACALHWFNPLAWLWLRVYREDIEAVCDDAAVRDSGDSASYATALVEAARHMVRMRAPAGAMMRSHGIAARIRRVLEQEEFMPQPSLFTTAVLYAGATAVFALVATAGLVSAQASPRIAHLDAATPVLVAVPLLAHGPNILLATNDPVDEVYRRPAGPNEGVLYLNVARGITVHSEQAGFMCGDRARCKFTVARDIELTLSLDGDSRSVRWKGCQPSGDGRACSVRVTHEGVRVDVEGAD